MMKAESSSSSSVKNQLSELRRDVKQLTVDNGIVGQVLLGWWLNPIKNMVADPVLGLAENTVPAVTSVIPFSAQIVGFGLSATSHVGHLAHAVGCRAGVFTHQENKIVASQITSRGLLDESYSVAQEFQEFFRDDDDQPADKNFLFNMAAFAMDWIAMLLRAQRLSVWFKTLKDFRIMLEKSGWSLEDFDSIPDLLPNMILLSRLQDRNIHSNKTPTRDDLKNGQYYMKYAAAAYAMTAVDVADTERKRRNGSNYQQSRSLRHSLANGIAKYSLERERSQMYICNEPYEYQARRRVCQHVCDAKENDVDMFVKQGVVLKALRHFVAVNHVQKAIVLSIRGTFSLAEALQAGSAELKSYCGGKAHSGMANQADRLWYVVGDLVKARLKEHPRYALVITGHGLGGGVACLLTIKAHHERLLGTTTPVKCYAFASPPVFAPLEAAPAAVANTVGYIHDDDFFPFLSLANMKQFMQSIYTVQESRTNALAKVGVILGNREPPEELVKSVKRSTDRSRADTVNGTRKSYVPASRVVWMRGCVEEGYKAHVFDPQLLPEVYVDVDMFNDHAPSAYEDALQMLVKDQNWNSFSLSKLAQIHSFQQDHVQ